LSKEELAPHAPSAADIDEFNRALGVQEQAPVKFSSSPIQQSSETTASAAELKSYVTREVNRFQLLVAAVDTFVNVTEDQLLTELTENDYQELVAALDKLIDVVGEDENHFLVPLMEFIGNLIEKYKGEVDMTASRPPGRGLRAAYNADEPEYTTAQLNLIKSQRQNPTVRQRTASRPPGRGLRAAYNADEPEYTTAQLNLIKSQRQNPTER
jgi:uncharacterized protein (DUF1778 family)